MRHVDMDPNLRFLPSLRPFRLLCYVLTLVSYPRSGNTFLRNVLYEVYGISSATFHNEAHGPDEGWEGAAVVKTHLLPDQLPEELLARPIVYLIRDGRDAIVSLAHHKKDLHDPESDVTENISEVIYAAEGSYFSGWSIHVDAWTRRAALIIHFERLIDDPIGTCEQLRPWLNLPEPKIDALPSFEQLKKGQPQYGSGKGVSDTNLAPIWFRRGKVGVWKEEMTTDQQRLFWHLHGETALCQGYESPAGLPLVQEPQALDQRDIRLLFEASKLLESYRDGVGRYVAEMLAHMRRFAPSQVQVDVLLEDRVIPIGALDEYLVATKASGSFQFLKRLLSRLLPAPGYHFLAKYYSTFRMHRRKAVNTRKTEDNRHYDAVILSLPQHYDRIQHLRFDRCFTVVHDFSHLAHPEFHTMSNVERCNDAFRYLGTLDKLHYLFVSDATKREASELGLKGKVIHEGVDRRRFFPNQNAHLKQLVRERYALPDGPFLLSLSTLEPRKNLKRLLIAYNDLDETLKQRYPLVLAGRKGWHWKEQGLEAYGSRHVHFTGFVREAHLTALYSMAHLFIYPSIYEGFGLPILEAQACGTPVVCSNSTSMPEVGGEAAMYFDPLDVADITKVISAALFRTDHDAWCIQSMEHSWRFSWRTAMEQLLCLVQAEGASTTGRKGTSSHAGATSSSR